MGFMDTQSEKLTPVHHIYFIFIANIRKFMGWCFKNQMRSFFTLIVTLVFLSACGGGGENRGSASGVGEPVMSPP